uniref:Uncharacterized protein n=1 Tax=Opuntia streptacantha TaxID=393608 RepID=A0A7C9AGF1_OPUST
MQIVAGHHQMSLQSDSGSRRGVADLHFLQIREQSMLLLSTLEKCPPSVRQNYYLCNEAQFCLLRLLGLGVWFLSWVAVSWGAHAQDVCVEPYYWGGQRSAPLAVYFKQVGNLYSVCIWL